MADGNEFDTISQDDIDALLAGLTTPEKELPDKKDQLKELDEDVPAEYENIQDEYVSVKSDEQDNQHKTPEKTNKNDLSELSGLVDQNEIDNLLASFTPENKTSKQPEPEKTKDFDIFTQDDIDSLLGNIPKSEPKIEQEHTASETVSQDDIDALLGNIPKPEPQKEHENKSISQSEIESLLAGYNVEDKTSKTAETDSDKEYVTQEEIEALFKSPVTKQKETAENKGSAQISQNDIDALFKNINDSPTAPVSGSATEQEGSSAAKTISQNEIEALIADYDDKKGKQEDSEKEYVTQDEIESLFKSYSPPPVPETEKQDITAISQNDIDDLLSGISKTETAKEPEPAVSETISQDDIDALLNGAASGSSFQKPEEPLKTEKNDLTIVSQEDIDSLFETVSDSSKAGSTKPGSLKSDGSETASTDSKVLPETDKEAKSLSEKEIEDLLSGYDSKKDNIKAQSEAEFVTQKELDDILRSAEKLPEQKKPQVAEEAEDLPIISQSEIDDLLRKGVSEEPSPSQEEEPDFIDQGDIDRLLAGAKEADLPFETEPGSSQIRQEYIDHILSMPPEDIFPPGYEPGRTSEKKPKPVAETYAESLQDTDILPLSDTDITPSDIDDLLNVSLKAEPEPSSKKQKEKMSMEVITQDDIDTLLAESIEEVKEIETSEEEPEIISQDDIERLMKMNLNDAEMADAESPPKDVVTQQQIDDLLNLAEYEPEPENVQPKSPAEPESDIETAGNIASVGDQVVILEEPDEAKKGPEKKTGKREFKSVLKKLMKISVFAGVLISGILIGGTAVYFLTGGKPSAPHETITASAPSKPSETQVPDHETAQPQTQEEPQQQAQGHDQAADHGQEAHEKEAEKPREVRYVSTELNGFVIPAPPDIKDAAYITADVRIELADSEAIKIKQKTAYYRGIIYNSIVNAILSKDDELLAPENMQLYIEETLVKAFPENSVRYIELKNYSIL